MLGRISKGTLMIDERRKGLLRADHLFSQVRTAIDPNVPTQIVQAFLTVALNEGASLTDISEKMGSVSLSTTSRHLLDLGERNRKMEPGYGLVARTPDPMELRKNQYTLTARGKLLADTITRLMEG